WSRSRDGVEFALIWMLAPPLLLMGISLLLRPVFVERYLLSCFVPFFLLVAIGINQTGALRSKLTALAIVSAFALGHVHAYERKPHDAQWREAATIAAAGTANNASIAVAPGYAVNVVRYYLRAR